MTLDRETRDRLRAIFTALEHWDMLTLRPDGYGQATADAPWAREMIARGLALLDAMGEPDAGLRHRHVGIEEIAATLQSLGHIHQQDTSKLFTPEPVDTCQGCGVEWPCETVYALERLFVEEPDAPVLVWESDDGDETLLHAESESYAGKLGAKWLLVQLASGDWAIYPPTELDHYSVRILKLVPTLAEAQDLAERIERELRR